MNKKIILTSVLAISIVGRAVAGALYPAGVGGSTTCNNATLGQSENNATANVEAVWTPKAYEVKYRCSESERFSKLRIAPCDELDTNPASCVTSKRAVYGYNYTFMDSIDATGLCDSPMTGYTFNGWSCNSGNADDTNTTFASGQTINWNIDSGLFCTAQWSANTINIDWYSDNTRIAQNTCSYGGTITTPQLPTKTGYTFNGWLLHDDCPDLNSQSACNMNINCAWDTQNSTCVNIGNNCFNLNESECNANPFCDYDMTCYTDTTKLCNTMQTEEQCQKHKNNNCMWNNGQYSSLVL